MPNSDHFAPANHPASVKTEYLEHTEIDSMSPESRLFDAIANHDQLTIKELLKSPGLDLSQINDDGQTLLHVAADRGNVEAAADLIQYHKDGKDVLTCNGDEWLARMAVAELKHRRGDKTGDFKFLDAQDRNGLSALMIAAHGGHLTLMQDLIDAGAEVDDNAMSIQEAVYAAEKQDLKCLAVYGDPDYPNPFETPTSGFTALMFAIAHAQIMAIDKLLDAGASMKKSFLMRCSPFRLATQSHQLQSAAALIKRGALAVATPYDCETLLERAVQLGDASLIEKLLQGNPTLSVRGKTGHALLTAAVSAGHADAVEALIQAGADIAVTDRRKYTLLMLAAESNKAAVIRVLHKYHANLEARSIHVAPPPNRGPRPTVNTLSGKTALLIATAAGNMAAATALLEIGADVNARDNYGSTALILAIGKRRHMPMVAILLKHEANLEIRNEDRLTPFMLSLEQLDVELMNKLHAAGANINARYPDGSSPVLWSIRKKSLMLDMLLRLNPDVTLADSAGITPLRAAIDDGSLMCAQELLKVLRRTSANPDEACRQYVNAADNNGITPLMIASGLNRDDIMRWLVEAGADVAKKNNAGHDAITFAIRAGALQAVEYLTGQLGLGLPQAPSLSRPL